MRKINKILIGLILLASMFLSIGYCAISNITFNITGSIKAGKKANVTSAGTYLPKSFTEVSGTSLATGLTIQDSSGNQYVWIEVPKTLSVYPTAGLDIVDFTADECNLIETDLHTYTAVYDAKTPYKDTWYSSAQHGFASADAYNEHKYKMLKSVYQNGGFYIGKYETGIADTEPEVVDTNHEARTAKGDATQTPVIQADAYPYNFVTCTQAQQLATNMASGEYTSSLLFGIQWDLVLKHFENKGTPQSDLINSSISWGNYRDNLWTITNPNSKSYYGSWKDGPYGTKTSTYTSVLLSTGADSSFSKYGIYDLAGNEYEWTLEYTTYTYYPCATRGGYYTDPATNSPAAGGTDNSTTYSSVYTGFRVTIF